jgi:hypothetical protein
MSALRDGIRISICDCFKRKFELANSFVGRYTPGMSEPLESSLEQSAFAQFLPALPNDAGPRQWKSAPVHISIKRSLIAGALLIFYMAAYVVVGFAGITVIERFWSAVVH